MRYKEYDLVIIGGGAAGLVAAISAKKEGVGNILILEREESLGGALNEYIHSGFGLKYFKEELTGTEFAQKLIDEVKVLKIKYMVNTIVLDFDRDKKVTYMNSKSGINVIKAKTIILAMGSRERPRGAMNIPRSKCAGIFTAGSAQKFVNKEGYLPGKEVVIMGSGDMGAIIARRLILEGAKVKAIVEHMPYITASDRNVLLCFQAFKLPVLFSHTVIKIKGDDRVEGVVVAQVDQNKKIIPGTEEEIDCDSLILSIGLKPENELAKKIGIEISGATKGPVVNDDMETSMEGVFACGNAVHIHNLADHVAYEAEIAARKAADYLKGIVDEGRPIPLEYSSGIKYTVPMSVGDTSFDEDLTVFIKVEKNSDDQNIAVYFDEEKVKTYKKLKFSVGNLESITLPKELLKSHSDMERIYIKME